MHNRKPYSFIFMGFRGKKSIDNICSFCNIFENSNATAKNLNSEFRKLSLEVGGETRSYIPCLELHGMVCH